MWEDVRRLVTEANPGYICGDGRGRDSRDYCRKAECPQQYFQCKKGAAERDVVDRSQPCASAARDHNSALFFSNARATREEGSKQRTKLPPSHLPAKSRTQPARHNLHHALYASPPPRHS